jgi:hypothetical protein
MKILAQVEQVIASISAFGVPASVVLKKRI